MPAAAGRERTSLHIGEFVVRNARRMSEQVGVDRVLYGSDYPFNLGGMTGVLARVDALGPERADAIRSGNALALFDL